MAFWLEIAYSRQLLGGFGAYFRQNGLIVTLYGSNDVFPQKEGLLWVTTIDDVIWGIFSQMTSSIVETPKRHFLARKHVV